MAKIKDILLIADSLRRLADELVALLDPEERSLELPQESIHELPQEQPQSDVDAQPAQVSTITLEELRAFVSARSSVENRPKIKAILNKLGVNKLTELAPDQYELLKNEVALL